MTDRDRVLNILQFYESGGCTDQEVLFQLLQTIHENNLNGVIDLIPGKIIDDLEKEVHSMPHSEEGWAELLIIFGGTFLPEGVSSDEEYQARLKRLRQQRKDRFRRGVEALRAYFDQNPIL